ncbi:hypothetical protein K469DRAFT_490586, partial [Zopfia rhizophila CBS 207.26]
INYILRKYLDVFILVYFNNILVYINGTLDKYTEKCVFHRKKVKFLEYIIFRNRIAVNLDKAK